MIGMNTTMYNAQTQQIGDDTDHSQRICIVYGLDTRHGSVLAVFNHERCVYCEESQGGQEAHGASIGPGLTQPPVHQVSKSHRLHFNKSGRGTCMVDKQVVKSFPLFLSPFFLSVFCKVDIMAAGATESREARSREGSSCLYFFYDCEGSGGSAIRDQMIEVAAVVMTENLGLEPGDAERLGAAHYSSLCRCSSEIQEGAWLKHGIDRESLAHERPVGEVLEEMFDWLGERAKEVERLKQRSYQTVLVAHGGIAFDFPLLVTEVKRSHCEPKFRDMNLQFADTHVLCQQLKTAGDPVLRGSTKLSVSELQSVYFPTAEESHPDGQPHRALSDAVTLRRMFTQTPLSAQMSQLGLVSTEDLVQRWQLSDDTHQLSESLGLHKQKARSLVRQGESLIRLEERFRGSGCSEQWLKEHLRSLGVKRPGQTCLQHFRKII